MDRRGSDDFIELPALTKSFDIEEYETQQKQRRNSVMSRRVSLVEAIPEFSGLRKTKKAEKVFLCSVTILMPDLVGLVKV